MAFTKGGTDPKYRTRAHRLKVAEYKRDLAREGALQCTARECLLESRDITNPDGRQPDGLTAGHNDDGDQYDGPQHRICNVTDGARRGRAQQDQDAHRWIL